MVPADLCRLRAVGDVRLHPDGESIVYAIEHPDAETDSNRSQLYTVDLSGDNNRKLTHGHNDARQVFSPDGTMLAFVRTEPKQPTRVMVMSWPLGEIVEAAAFHDEIGAVRWLPTGAESAGRFPHRLVVSAGQRPENQRGVDDGELARRPRILRTINYRFNGRGWTHDRPRQLFLLTDPFGEHRDPIEIGTPGVDHGDVAVSPDGRRIAATAATDDDADLTGGNHVWLYTLDGSHEPTRLTPSGGRWESLLWHPDGRLVVTGRADISTVGFSRPHLVGLPETDRKPAVRSLGHHDYNVSPALLGDSGQVALNVAEAAILYPGVRNGRIGIDRYDLDDGGHRILHEGPHQVLAFDASDDGRTIVAAITTTERPAELWRIEPAGDTETGADLERAGHRKLVTLNEDVLAELDLAETEVISVTSADGTEVEAFVVRPPASAPEGTTGSASALESGPGSPGLVYVHGGPMFQYGLYFFDEFQLAAACGYVVIAGNPRGSDGYGEAWARSIVGDLGNKDWADVSALADHLQALPEVDADRIGMGGGSYGGFMTGWALGHDKRFRAGLIERAVTSWNTFYGTSDIGNFFARAVIGATIEDDPDEVTRQSPLHHAADITVPTLIVHSEEDWRCPIEQAEQLFAAIRRNGGEVTMVRFPGENHELSRSGRPSHRIERFEIVHEFFAQHLGGGDFGTDHLRGSESETTG